MLVVVALVGADFGHADVDLSAALDESEFVEVLEDLGAESFDDSDDFLLDAFAHLLEQVHVLRVE